MHGSRTLSTLRKVLYVLVCTYFYNGYIAVKILCTGCFYKYVHGKTCSYWSVERVFIGEMSVTITGTSEKKTK